jgi:hypothetical protein
MKKDVWVLACDDEAGYGLSLTVWASKEEMDAALAEWVREKWDDIAGGEYPGDVDAACEQCNIYYNTEFTSVDFPD